MDDIKNWTGERLETFVYNETMIEHLHRYAFTFKFIAGKDVLDIASGEGYGSKLMALHAKTVVGVDISQDAIDQAKQKYKSDNLSFTIGSASEIPVADHSVDVLVSFETLEHHTKHIEMFTEIKRVLRPDGILIMSTPDKYNYSDRNNYVNPFHVKELYTKEFYDLVSKHFKYPIFFKQCIFQGSIIIPDKGSNTFAHYSGNYETIYENENYFPPYNVCIASDFQLYQSEASVFEGASTLNKAIIQYVQESTIKEFRSSWTYKIGNFILSPLRVFSKK